jgi:hypothetical protein
MKHVLFWLVFVVLVLVAMRALAAREGRARAVFDDRCALCHVVGWGTAQQVKRKGIVAQRIQSAGYGDTRPNAPNDTETNRSRNRRIEFNVRKD